MAFVIADRVKETTTSTGTTAITLAGAVTGYQTFSASIGNANTTYYTIADQSGANWEVGVGTYTSSGNTLSRDTVLASSNSGSLVTFTSGTKDVFVSAPAERFGPNWQTVQTGNFTASSNCAYPVDTTSAAITATLPVSPKVNDIISFVDYAGTFATNNLTLYVNGNKVDASTYDQKLTTNRTYLSLVYINSTQGWVSCSNIVLIPVPPSYTVEYIVVSGGGGGGQWAGGGGGGGGGVIVSSVNVSSTTAYPVVVGAGGASGSSSSQNATIGTSSSFNSTAPIGGGYGGYIERALGVGGNGGSGGGGANGSAGGTSTSGQGYAGGVGGNQWTGAGGGGAGAVGSNASGNSPGNGGNGVTNSYSGSSTYYSGGGGGGRHMAAGSTSTGGLGGGAVGGAYSSDGSSIGGSGTVNTGGGGGGAGGITGVYGTAGGPGGSGIVILRYTGSQKGTGGTVTSSGGYTIHTFTSSGTYTA